MSRPRRQIRGLLGVVCLAIAATASAGQPNTGAKRAMFNDNTYQELKPYAASDRLIAVLRCEAIEILSPGSRRERQQIRGTVLAGPATLPRESSLLLSRHAQGKPLMEVGKVYLVAGYRESTTGPWALVEHRPVEANAAAGEYETASAEATQRLDAERPR